MLSDMTAMTQCHRFLSSAGRSVPILVALLAWLVGITGPAMGETRISAARGTLDVVLATRRCIVVATDSRRSGPGIVTDDSQKLFRVGDSKALAISGLADVSIAGAAD